MNIVGIIPARMESTRFPGKPLANILGKAMIYHVYFRSKLCKELNEIYLATPNNEIKKYCEKNGMKVIMTKNTHERAVCRTAEAMSKLERKTKKKIDIVVMIQGDEPMVLPEMIKKAIKPMLHDKSIRVVNLMTPLKSKAEQNDPNHVKVVADKRNFALYFSREPIPSWKRGARDAPMYKQVPIIPFRRDFLIQFNKLPPTALEAVESVDMLRILEHGYKLKMVPVSFGTYSVDVPKDLRRVERLMKHEIKRRGKK